MRSGIIQDKYLRIYIYRSEDEFTNILLGFLMYNINTVTIICKSKMHDMFTDCKIQKLINENDSLKIDYKFLLSKNIVTEINLDNYTHKFIWN